MFWLRIFKVQFQCILNVGETKAGNVEITIFTSSAHDLVCPAKHLTYCSQRQTQHAGRFPTNLEECFCVCHFTVLNIPTVHFDFVGKKNQK